MNEFLSFFKSNSEKVNFLVEFQKIFSKDERFMAFLKQNFKNPICMMNSNDTG